MQKSGSLDRTCFDAGKYKELLSELCIKLGRCDIWWWLLSFVCQLFRGIFVVSFPECCSNLARLLWHCGVMESMEINERENVIFLRLSNYKNTLFILCSCTSQKPSHGDISGTKSGIIDLLVSKQRKQISEEKKQMNTKNYQQKKINK